MPCSIWKLVIQAVLRTLTPNPPMKKKWIGHLHSSSFREALNTSYLQSLANDLHQRLGQSHFPGHRCSRSHSLSLICPYHLLVPSCHGSQTSSAYHQDYLGLWLSKTNWSTLKMVTQLHFFGWPDRILSLNFKLFILSLISTHSSLLPTDHFTPAKISRDPHLTTADRR